MSGKLQAPYEKLNVGHAAGALVTGNAPLAGDAIAQISSRIAGGAYGMGINPVMKGGKLVALTGKLPQKVQPFVKPVAYGAQIAAGTATAGTMSPYIRTFVSSVHSPLYTDILPGSITGNRNAVMNFPGVQSGLSFLDWAGHNKAMLSYKKAINKHAVGPVARRALTSETAGEQVGKGFRQALNSSPNYKEYWNNVQNTGRKIADMYKEKGHKAAGEISMAAGKEMLNNVAPFTRDLYQDHIESWAKRQPAKIVKGKIEDAIPTFGRAPRFFRGFVRGAAPEIPKQYQAPIANAVWNAPSTLRVARIANKVRGKRNNSQ